MPEGHPALVRALLDELDERSAKPIGDAAALVLEAVAADGLASRSSNTPLIGRELSGVVRLTVAGGHVTWTDGTVFPRSMHAAG